jgi:C-terminal processing protease CtpA/Prc
MKKKTYRYISFAERGRVAALSLCCLFLLGTLNTTSAQSLGPFDRDNARAMLEGLKSDLKSNYYDPSFRGMNLDARFKQAEEELKLAQTRDQLMITVALVLLELDDSHTFFAPPSRAANFEYGWLMQMIGNGCYVTAVKPKSDAEAKGLKAGDAILTIDGVRPTREIVWKMIYRYYALMPARSVRLVVQSPGDAQPHQLDISAKIDQRPSVLQWEQFFVRAEREGWFKYHDRFYEMGNDLLIWKMPTFSVSEKHIDAMMGKAKNYEALIIDLRDNGSGAVKALERLVGYFFDKDLKISDEKWRKETKPSVAKTRGGDMFKGQLIVLVDSRSASASEFFARVMQLEKRGTVIGDRTMGAVMYSRYYDHQTGVGNVLLYGASVTVADVIMADGKSLEKVGVTPDEVLTPTGADLAAQRDPVLSRAAALAGVTLDPQKAGTLFPPEWNK